MKELSDEALMKLVVEGELDMMHHLYQRYKRRIYNFSLMMTRDKELSLDITQDVFYKLIKHRHTYKNTRFSSWVYAITRNLYIDHYQRQVRLKVQLTDQQTMTQVVDEPTEALGSDELLDQALSGLSMGDKELILMSKFQKLKYQEIAEITDSTVGAVKTRVHRAILKLREQYFQISSTS